VICAGADERHESLVTKRPTMLMLDSAGGGKGSYSSSRVQPLRRAIREETGPDTGGDPGGAHLAWRQYCAGSHPARSVAGPQTALYLAAVALALFPNALMFLYLVYRQGSK
jgi:hypothetical protein